MQPYITKLVGLWGQNESSKLILEGCFDTNIVSDIYLRRIIEELRQPNNVKLAGKESNEITLE